MLYGPNPYGGVEYGGIAALQNGTGIVVKLTDTNGVITNITSFIRWRTLEHISVLTKEVSTCRFNIFDTSGVTIPGVGDQIDLYENNTHKFGGTVTESKIAPSGGILLEYQINCIDWSFKINSRLVVKSYPAQDPALVVKDIISTFAGAGFTTYNVQTAGFDVASIKFNYEQVTLAIEKLAKQIGWEWFIDADKDIHFFPPNVMVDAPYPIDDTSGNLEWTTLNVDQSIVNMKNSIFVIGGNYTKTFDATSTPDKYLTDGVKSVFSLAYSYVPSTIIVLLNGVAQTVGTDQVTDPTSVQVLYNELSRFIKFTTVPATPSQQVVIYGLAQIPILAHVQNQAAIAAYGEIQDSIIDPQIKSIAEAQERGNAQVADFGSPVYGIKFSTLKTGFAIGQTVQVDSTLFGTDVLVEVKRITARLYSPTQFHYDIECVGTEKVSFIDVMKLLLLQGNAQTVVADSTVLQVLLLLEESIASSDSLSTPTTSSPPYLWGTMVWGFFTWS